MSDLEAAIEKLPSMVDGRGLKLVYQAEVIKLVKAHEDQDRAAKAEWSSRIRNESVFGVRKNCVMIPTKTMVELLELFEGKKRKGAFLSLETNEPDSQPKQEQSRA